MLAFFILSGRLEDLLENRLPGLMLQVLLAARCGAVPAWAADAVMEMGAASDDRKKGLNTECRKALDKSHGLRLKALFEHPGNVTNPDERVAREGRVPQAYSVTEFLIRQKDQPTFVEFVKKSVAVGADKAAKDVYGFADVAALETAWLDWLQKKPGNPDRTDPTRIPPVNPDKK
jgi:hypothetical protein